MPSARSHQIYGAVLNSPHTLVGGSQAKLKEGMWLREEKGNWNENENGDLPRGISKRGNNATIVVEVEKLQNT